MTDKDRLADLLRDFGVEFTEGWTTPRLRDEGLAIVCEAGSAKVSGYSSFYTEFCFDDDGCFVKMGIYE